ncbi:MAG TPA: hypothetical protein RMG48_09535 [Myxococcales bacterium LLY-WYZ-16_1]|nr:hypothetical protein [Myxococcales bacterium LLY-WYZ-16_1]
MFSSLMSTISNLWNGSSAHGQHVVAFDDRLRQMGLVDDKDRSRDEAFWQQKEAQRATQNYQAAVEKVQDIEEHHHHRWVKLAETGRAGVVPGAQPRESLLGRQSGQFGGHELGGVHIRG